MDDGDSMWSRKGATLSGKSARQERGSALVRMESASLRSFAPTCVTGGTHRPGCAATGIRWGGARHLGFAPTCVTAFGPKTMLRAVGALRTDHDGRKSTEYRHG